MRGLYIDFELKRRSQLNRLMDYIVMLALFVFAFTFFVYIPDKEMEKTLEQARESKLATYASYLDTNEQVTPFLPPSASAPEQRYYDAYEEIKNNILYFDQYIETIYQRLEDSKIPGQTDRVSISKLIINSTDKTFTLTVTYTGENSDVFYIFYDSIDRLIWVNNLTIVGTVSSNKTVMVITYE